MERKTRMGLLHQCNRCKRTALPSETLGWLVDYALPVGTNQPGIKDDGVWTVTVDLCNVCLKSLQEWWKK